MPKHILVTGAAGFIGSTLSLRLLERGDTVVGLDNLNDYYSVALKQARLTRLKAHPGFRFEQLDVADRDAIAALFAREHFDGVVNLAAQAGVRYSIQNPHAYVDSNLVGFVNLLEGARHSHVGHFVFASSSSVYGANERQPFSEHDAVDHPISLYAASKKANELMAHSYAHLFGLPCTGLRFFTVYGPWGRPDMALFLFTKGILAGQPIKVFNHGRMVRDFTYIDDIVEGVVRVLDQPAAANAQWDGASPDPATSKAPYRIYNIGNNRPIELMRYIEVLEECLGKKAIIEYLPMQDGDVPSTVADVSALTQATGFAPATTVEEGVSRFVRWYLEYHEVSRASNF
ncbi:MAG TPA: NAD-dependent epimerase [Acidiferrobacteraceae bacterium]|nr:NAD-dependent epimerase [Acidiferrobacteraceae bacterium]